MANQRASLSGSSITGVSGAQHGAQQNAQAMQRAAQKAGSVGAAAGAAGQASYEFGSELGAGAGAAGRAGAAGAQLAGNNITGVSGAQHGAQKNAQAMQRLSGKSGV